MTPAIQAAIWDMDGVLVDTTEMHYQAFKATLPAYGLPFSWDHFRVIFGMGNREGLAYLAGRPLDETLLAEIIDQKETRFRDLVRGQARTLPGVMEWLNFLRDAQVRQALASSAPQENIDAVVDELGLRGYFQAILSAPENGIPAKPEPAVFLESARRLGVEPSCCVVFEDSMAGVDAAVAAGMHCIAMTTTNPREKLLKADRVVETMLDIEKSWLGLGKGRVKGRRSSEGVF